jgi:hypothetical protein
MRGAPTPAITSFPAGAASSNATSAIAFRSRNT